MKGRIVKVLSSRVAVAGSLLIATMGVTHAEEVSHPFVAPVFRFGSSDVQNDQVVENPDGSFTMSGTDGSVAAGWVLGWNISVDYDPFINGSLTLTNFSSSAHNYKLTLDLPVSAFGPASVYGGSLTATVFDDSGDSAAKLGLSTASDASPGIYQGTIDGIRVLSLFGGIGCEGSGPHCSSTLSTDDGLPGPTIPGPAVNGRIGTILMFNLSAGDRVVFDMNFTVSAFPTPVPLPASAWTLLAAMGCMGYLLVSRRRAAA